MSGCKICGGKVRSSGLCYSHYERKRRYGDPEAKPPMGPKKGALRLYLERTGEWNRMLAYTSPQSRKKYHKAVNKLFALLRRPRPLGICDEDENVTIEMAMSLAAIIAFDENTDMEFLQSGKVGRYALRGKELVGTARNLIVRGNLLAPALHP